jgi:putative peptide zinc metalloprotease protein
MNLTEALNVALPDLPARDRKEYPRVHPKLVGRLHIEDGHPMMMAIISGNAVLYRLSPQAWELAQLCDGERSYEELSELYQAQTGAYCSPDEIRQFADSMAALNFWYKTPQEENIALTQKLLEERGRHIKKKRKYGDVSHIEFSAWDPDDYMAWVYRHCKFLYGRWFTLFSLVLMVFTIYVWASHGNQMYMDTLQYYNFREKSAADLAQFYIIAVVLLFFHETAHGLTVKHYGGEVHRFGFHLIYMTPAFFVDVTEAWVYAARPQRVVTIFSGVWSELLFCFVSTVVWWGTPAGTWVHDLAYKVMLFGGLAAIFFNWNPLIKLDGYYILSEILGIYDLKERSTAFVSGWVRKNIFQLPVEIAYVPPKRRLIYTVYALVSGAYSYALLYFFARLAGNIFKSFSPEWAFIPTVYVAYLLFRSRIRTLGRFMKTVYLDKKDRVRAWLTPGRLIPITAAVLAVLFLPVWREKAEGRFLLEPQHRAVLRAAVPGAVAAVYVQEGQHVDAGAPVARLRNLPLENDAAKTSAEYRVAAARATSAQFRYVGFAAADRERQQLAVRSRTLLDQVAQLELRSPISGVVVTPRVQDALGSYLPAGATVAEVADVSSMRARVFVPEFEMRKIRLHAPAALHFGATAGARKGETVVVSAAPSEGEPGLVEPDTHYKGLRPPQYYAVIIALPNPDGSLKPGMTGTAKILTRWRSLAGMGWEAVSDFAQRKIW